ncbi:MAG: hypothetical protein ACXV2H_12175 [Actinomycetes bacterium]|jgi:hypothetical protein
MDERAIGRRQMLRGAGVAAGGVAVSGIALASPAAASDDHTGLTGSFFCTRQDDGTTDKITVILSFAGGDVFLSHDINPAGPPFTGTWARDGKRFRATFWTGTVGGPNNQAGPTVRVRARGRVEGETITATYAFTAFDPKTGAVVDSGTGKLTGRRIRA